MNYVSAIKKTTDTRAKGNVYGSIFKEYERVVMESLIASFGLDFLVKDQHGGDVDTINNVRQIGKDSQMTYKKKAHEKAYSELEAYDTHKYHQDAAYIASNRKNKQDRDSGVLIDVYTGKRILPGDKYDQDHVISAKEIHDDRGRVLSGLDGVELANSPENLGATNPHTNRTKKAETMDDFIAKNGSEYTKQEIDLMKQKDSESRDSYEAKLNNAYYKSKDFMTSAGSAAANVGLRMGLRQALGFVFSEIWFAVKKNIKECKDSADSMFKKISDGIKTGLKNAKEKFSELWHKFIEGAISGILSSLVTSLCNIFLTTAKSVVKIIRQTWVSLVQAVKILFINPDNLPLGERLLAVAKILATGASIVAGQMVSELIATTPIGSIPVLGEIVQTFCGTMVSGIMSCTLLYIMDTNPLVQEAVYFLNNLQQMFKSQGQRIAEIYKQQGDLLEEYCAKLMKIDILLFKKQTQQFMDSVVKLENCKTEKELSLCLDRIYKEMDIKLAWKGDLSEFMGNPNNKLVFR